jgi:hypothetical protein
MNTVATGVPTKQFRQYSTYNTSIALRQGFGFSENDICGLFYRFSQNIFFFSKDSLFYRTCIDYLISFGHDYFVINLDFNCRSIPLLILAYYRLLAIVKLIKDFIESNYYLYYNYYVHYHRY